MHHATSAGCRVTTICLRMCFRNKFHCCSHTQYRTYPVQDGKGGKKLPFILCDTMGMESTGDENGIHIDDIISVIKGHVPDTYEFNPKAPINRNDKRYRVEPRLADKVHCVVYVVEADKICLMDQNLLKKFKLFRTEVNNMEIPLLVLVTKIDEACPEVKKDLTKVYRSRYLYEKVIEVEHMLGAPISSISPIKNYSTETELNLHMDVLILKALQQMLRAADAYLDNMNQQDPHSVKQFLRFLFCRCSKT
ncbi:interferon-induced protein 44-like [Polypterus senegalus]|uniref:interferon-induced protein 44-like n=1 Tax=Polypterus senegalus TaxID=55291 RepID=UPI001965B414|nr:interferon-induced protein 44-like [Polypterus senegalus]